jgi:hypothetical protein
MPDTDPYTIFTVLKDASSQLEQLGTKSKFWYRDSDNNVLFKEGRPETGENWAEKVCCEICVLLGLPHAHYDFAVWRNHEGVITPSIVPEGARLILGNELLARINKDYDADQRYRARQHTVGRVIAATVFPGIQMPFGWERPPEIEAAADLMVGYLMLDALVSNQDRHHENWGLILSPEHRLHIAPTFDHASSLGRNETDERRTERLTTRDAGMSVGAFVQRARTPLYKAATSTRPLTTLEAYTEAAKLRPKAAEYWTSQLGRLDSSMYQGILDKVPDNLISVVARKFALKMIEENTQRILGL